MKKYSSILLIFSMVLYLEPTEIILDCFRKNLLLYARFDFFEISNFTFKETKKRRLGLKNSIPLGFSSEMNEISTLLLIISDD